MDICNTYLLKWRLFYFLEKITSLSWWNLSSLKPVEKTPPFTVWVFDAKSQMRWSCLLRKYVFSIWGKCLSRGSTSWKTSTGWSSHLMDVDEGCGRVWLRAVHMQCVWKHFESYSVLSAHLYMIWKIFIWGTLFQHMVSKEGGVGTVFDCFVCFLTLEKPLFRHWF